MDEIKLEIMETLRTLSIAPSSWAKELNLVSWNG